MPKKKHRSSNMNLSRKSMRRKQLTIQRPKTKEQRFIAEVTKFKEMEKALREAEEKYRALVESSLTGIFINQAGKYVFVNERFAQIHGYKPHELLGKKYRLLIHHPERPRTAQIRKRMLTGEKTSRRYEVQRLRKDGQVIWCEMLARRIKYGGKFAIMGNIIDITERKEAEQKIKAAYQQLKASELQLKAANQQLRASEQQLRAANQQLRANEQQLSSTNQQLRASEQQLKAANQQLEATNQQLRANQEEIESLAKFPAENTNPVMRIARDGTIIYANPASPPILQTWGCNEGQVLPETWCKRTKKALRAGKLSTLEFNSYDGRTFAVTLAPIKEQGYVNVYGLDITDRKKAEEKLLDYQAQLKSLASQLTLTEERERSHLATELHAGIGQSLAISKLKIDILRTSGLTKSMVNVLKEISDLLDETISEIRRLTFDLSSPILHELGFEAAVAAWLNEEIEQKYGIEVELEEDKKPKPLGDDIKTLLFRDVRELLTNVVKHSKATKTKVSIRCIGDRIRVGVEDNGVGFNPAEVAAKSVKEGGFGLFSIRQGLEQSGGYLEIKSAPGCGCKITMLAPLKEDKNTKRV